MPILGSTLEFDITASTITDETVMAVTVTIVDPDGSVVVNGESATEVDSTWVYVWQSSETGTAGDYIVKAKAISEINVGKGKLIITMEEA